ncbi:MAG: hypothetical protein AAGC46_08270 [Solirubrobacteraceae bacterium]
MKGTVRLVIALVLVFVVVTAVADVAGAKNLGTAMTFGQIGFAICLVLSMLWGTRGVVRDAAGRTSE